MTPAEARLELVRAAARVRLKDGRQVSEALRDELPRYASASPESRNDLVRALTRRYLPGAQWLVEVVGVTFAYWDRPDVGPQDRLLVPFIARFNASGAVCPADLEVHAEYLDQEEAEAFAKMGRAGIPATDQTPARPRPGRPRAVVQQAHLVVLARFQWGAEGITAASRTLGLTRKGALDVLRRAARLVGLRLRERGRGGAPRGPRPRKPKTFRLQF